MIIISMNDTTFVIDATEPLFFFARSAVEFPTVLLAFTVKPSFTCNIIFILLTIAFKKNIEVFDNL